MKSVCRYYRRHGPAIWRDMIKADNWTGQLDDIRNAEATVQEDSRIFNALEIRGRLGELDSASQVLRGEMQDIWPTIKKHILSEKEERCLKDLRVTDPRDDKSRIEDTNGGLLQGAHDWAIKHSDFIAWRDEKANHMLWIKGDPGKGKTMLLCGIIDELQRQSIKPCYFFCQATDPRLNSATAVLRGLIYLLVDTNRQLLSHIQEKYDQAGAALFQDTNSWVVLSQIFTELLKDPSLEGQVFMIDALDECQKDLERLLDLIVGKSIGPHAKWIVSSRNWDGIEEKLSTISQNIRFSLELNEHSVSEADEKTELIIRNYLTDNAKGTFLWVALVCKELLKLSVRKRHVLKKMEEFPSDLVPIYERTPQQIRTSEDSDLSTLRRDMYNLRYSGALVEEHTLNEDKDVLKHARYSCVYWVDHLKAVNDLEREKCMLSLKDNGIVHHFLKEKLLNWLEALSLMNKMRDAARIVRVLKKLSIREEYIMRNLIEDVFRFVLAHKVGIELAPLQVYSSALIFSPSSSIIRQMYEETEVPKWIITKPEMPVEWTALVQSLEGKKSTCFDLAFSPDGALIASASAFGKVSTWDLETGTRLHTLECSSDFRLLAFSPNGKLLAMGSSNLVKIYDLSALTWLHGCSFGINASVHSLAFSLDSTRLAASYGDKHREYIIRTWDLGTRMQLKTHNLGIGTCLLKIDQLDHLWDLNFSVTSTRVMTMSGLAHVGIWDYATGECLQQFKLYPSCEASALSPDGMSATVSMFLSDIEIWDVSNDGPLDTLMNTRTVCATVFSPDGTQLAIASSYFGERCVINIHDPTTGICLKEFEPTQERHIYSMVFFPDGKRLVSSASSKFEIWDVLSGVNLQVIDSQLSDDWVSRSVRLTISSDDTLMAASDRGMIHIWRLSTGEKFRHTIDEMKARFGCLFDQCVAMAFSPDGTQLGLTLESSVVRIYDVQTGTCLRILDDFFEPIFHDTIRYPQLRLQADLRIFDYRDCMKTPPTQRALMRRTLSAFTVSSIGTWIMRGKQRVLWLPQEYRPSTMEVYDEFVACRARNGRFSCFQFAIDELDKVLA
ncbi:uncharacterized protein Triagg1_1160 [Trichoderma aggressivum f. europaeum]|uniref:NACHT domain-containing protein n=1 Tax=Trichoderma aggressivum f. europaeum TaxID=173218 RepID=A0AAE1M3Z3_9HYPO|nr:hypothetical protein Triagg1_1160 [Trichoderma aggressivum f. europaeum]